MLTVADRLGDVQTFGTDDALLLDTMANHAAVAMRNGELLGQLRHEASHDALTGLPNRVQLQRRVAARPEAVAAGESRGRPSWSSTWTSSSRSTTPSATSRATGCSSRWRARLGAAVGRPAPWPPRR